MRRTLTTIGLALAVTAPAHGWRSFRNIRPERAVIAAARAAPAGVSGIFTMTVRAMGHQNGHFYLNSELDYRDQRNLTIAMSDSAGAALVQKAGLSSERSLIGHKIFVRGIARRVQIDFVVDGRHTDKYYYQTHVVVTAPEQVTVRDKL